jgi:hypothetical protein
MRSHASRLHVYPKHHIYGKAFYAHHLQRRTAACGYAPAGSAAELPCESRLIVLK